MQGSSTKCVCLLCVVKSCCGGGGQVQSVCTCDDVLVYLCTCCMLLRVVVRAGVKYQGKRSDDTNCEVHPKSPPMFNS